MFLARSRRATAFNEYAIILSVISLVFVSMNVYIKRGLQGRVKDMSDYLIAPGSEHTERMYDKSDSTTVGQTETNVNYNTIMHPEGEVESSTGEIANVTSSTSSIDTSEEKE